MLLSVNTAPANLLCARRESSRGMPAVRSASAALHRRGTVCSAQPHCWLSCLVLRAPGAGAVTALTNWTDGFMTFYGERQHMSHLCFCDDLRDSNINTGMGLSPSFTAT